MNSFSFRFRLTIFLSWTFVILVIIAACAPTSLDELRKIQSITPSGKQVLTPGQAYAGEVLAYLLKVVAGRAGQVEDRVAWQQRGLDVDLDFAHIRNKMTATNTKMSELLVLDPKILGLSEVLYYYNPLLNEFKGDYIFDSLYPSAELLSLRLLLIQKLARSEKVRLEELLKREANLFKAGNVPSPEDIESTNLTQAEILLLRDVIQSDPLFRSYYKHPFLVKAFHQIGIIEESMLTRQAEKSSSYQNYRLSDQGASSHKKATRIAILPSMTREFEFGESYPKPYRFGFKPTAMYKEVVEDLEKKIITSVRSMLVSRQKALFEITTDAGGMIGKALLSKLETLLHFEVHDRRPFVITPQNARESIRQISPEADFAVVILGKNVGRSMVMDDKPDDFGAKGYIFLDIMDIRYDQIQSETESIGRTVAAHLVDSMHD